MKTGPGRHDLGVRLSDPVRSPRRFPDRHDEESAVSLGRRRVVLVSERIDQRGGTQARGVDIWAEWATAEQTARFGREAGDLGPIYGYFWRSFGGDYPKMNGVDQIARLINEIETNPNSRRLIVTRLEPARHVTTSPCRRATRCSNSRSRTKRRCTANSTNARPMPFSACRSISSSYALLTHLVAHVCGLEVGEFIHTFGDLHIYSNHLEQVNELLSREPMPLPKLEFVDADELKGLDGLFNFKFENLKLENYQSWGKIAAPVAV